MSAPRSFPVSRGVLAAAALATTLFAGVLIAGPAQGGTAPPAPPPTTGGPTAPNPSPFPPTMPGNVVATAVTTGSITLSWTASAGGCCSVAGYDILWGLQFNDVFNLTKVGNVTTATITSGVRAKSEYFFQLTAFDDVGHRSATTARLAVVTPATDTGSDTVPPGAPTGLTTSAVTAAGQPLTWSPATDNVGVVAYDIYRFDNWFASTVIGSTTGTSYVVPPAAGSLYVRARDAAGNISIASNLVAGAGTTTPPTTTPPPPPTCSVSYAVTAQWVHGFTAGVTVTNTGPAAITGWTLGFTFGGTQKVVSAWNGTATQTGATVTVKNAHWNGALAPGASATAGLQGTWSGSNPPPTAYTLNGLPCTVIG
jgi:cellulose binding protein with CBM2 domain/fibronectin type III domain protein